MARANWWVSFGQSTESESHQNPTNVALIRTLRNMRCSVSIRGFIVASPPIFRDNPSGASVDLRLARNCLASLPIS